MQTFKTSLRFYREHKQVISVTLGILFVILIGYYITVNIREFSSLRITNFWLVALIFFSVLVRNFSTGLQMDTVLRPLGVRLKIVESFGLANLTRLINQILPGKVGIVMRSMYLKKRHNLPYASFVSSFAASQIVLYLVSSLLGIVGYSILYFSGTKIHVIFLYALIAAVIFLTVLLLFPKKISSRITHNRLSKALTSWQDIRSDTRGFYSLLLWTIVFIASSTVIMYSSFNSLGADISLWVALFFSSINIVNALIAITPAGFGISEGIVVLLAQTVGIDAPVALAAALLQRVVTFFAVVIVAPYFSRKLFNLSLIQLLRKRFR
jgi:uncharacterized protein (TIRG00374 family)